MGLTTNMLGSWSTQTVADKLITGADNGCCPLYTNGSVFASFSFSHQQKQQMTRWVEINNFEPIKFNCKMIKRLILTPTAFKIGKFVGVFLTILLLISKSELKSFARWKILIGLLFACFWDANGNYFEQKNCRRTIDFYMVVINIF